MISPILPAHDADTVALDLGVFIAEHARTFRTSQTAIIAALRPVLDRDAISPLEPSQSTTSKSSVSAADSALDGDLITTPSQPDSSKVMAAETPAAQEAGETDGEAGLTSQVSPSVQPDPAASAAPDAQGDAAGTQSSEPAAPKSESHQGEILGREVSVPRDTAETGKSGEGHEPSPAPVRGRPETVRAKVIECHQQHPTWPSKLVAEHLGISEDQVRATASRKGLKLVSWWDYVRSQKAKTTEALKHETVPSGADPVEPAPAASAEPPIATPKPERETLASKIRAHLAEHPDATLKEVSDALGARMTSVSWAAQRAGIELRKRTPEEISEVSIKSAVGRSRPPTIIQPPPAERDASDVLHEVRRPAKQARFYVRDKAGRYLHQSLERSPTDTGPLMTVNRKWAWFDNAQRFAGACKKWPEIGAMRQEGPNP